MDIESTDSEWESMDSESMDSGDESSSSESVASFVCDICQGFGDMKNPRGFILKIEREDHYVVYEDTCYTYVYIHHPDVETLLASEKEGCNVCAVICSRFREYCYGGSGQEKVVDLFSLARQSNQPDSVANATHTNDETLAAARFAGVVKQERGFTKRRIAGYDNGRIVLIVDCNRESGPRGSTRTSDRVNAWALATPLRKACKTFFTIFKSAYDPLDAELKHRPSHDLLSGPHIGLINRWRDTCKMEHKSCRETTYSQPLPSRVIELFETGDRQDPCAARLIETHGTMEGTYVCLSYCWGDSQAQNQTGQTTSANLSKQLEAVPFNSLPKTVVDTIHLCYKLGFRFLWVDRLCIIQDDKEDWKHEASQMCDIYSRSALTISVPLCIESSQSFLEKRHNTQSIDCKGDFAMINYIDMESNSNEGLCFFRGSLWRREASWFLESSWDGITDIAPHYGNHWITRGWTFQEWILSPRVLHIDTMTLWDCFEGYANELNRRNMEKAIVLRDPRQLREQVSWDNIVEEYSSREITYEEDRLPALAGLAARYHQITGYTYLAGLWLEEMPRSLLWKAPIGTEATTPVSRTVPSWSWASLDTKAQWVHVKLQLKPRLWPTKDSFIPSASIHCWPGSPSSVSMNEKSWIDIKGHMNVVVVDQYDDEGFRIVKVEDESWHWFPDRGHKYSDEIAQYNVYLILLGATDEISITYVGLVLQKCGWNNGRPCFRRLGTAIWPGEFNEKLKIPPHGSSWEEQVVHLV